jgi:hypothetical protein
MTVIALLRDGRIIAQTAIPRTPLAATTPTAISATVTDLRKVEYILSLKLGADGNTVITAGGTSVYGNAVGITVNAAAGTTVFGEVITVGF